MHVEQLTELLIDEVRDLYHAEKQLVQALPKMAKAAESRELRDAFEEHKKETETHVARLEEVFVLLDTPAKAKACKGMQGLLAEGDEALQNGQKGFQRDLALIGAAQRVEHYEIAAYGTAHAMAEQLGDSQVTRLLMQTASEEKSADRLLTTIADRIYRNAGSGHPAARTANGRSKAEHMHA
ncbi:MAG TPA: ferritin-like domain-containing protein [Bryobacteraceae bacterium]|nr:ferritin-like domain-containing protein [Bryobacteraceae bacterium]